MDPALLLPLRLLHQEELVLVGEVLLRGHVGHRQRSLAERQQGKRVEDNRLSGDPHLLLTYREGSVPSLEEGLA